MLALVVTAGITLSMGQGIRLLVDQGFMTRSAHQLNQTIGLFLLLVLALAVGTFSRFYLVSWIGERCVADIRPCRVRPPESGCTPAFSKTTAVPRSSRG